MSQAYTASIAGTDDVNTVLKTTIPNNFAAIATDFAGATEPTTMFAYMKWLDTTNKVLKRRNAANSAWTIEGALGGAGGTVMLQESIVGTLATTTLIMGSHNAPWVVERIVLTSDTTTTGSSAGVTEYTVMASNFTQTENLFSATPSTATTVGGVGGGEWTANVVEELTVDQNSAIAANDVLRVVVTKVGSPTAVTRLKVQVFGYEVGA